MIVQNKNIQICNEDINKKVDTIVNKLRINKFSTEEKEIWYSLIHKVLLNEQTKLNKNYLLDVINSVNIYKDAEIIDYINSSMENVLLKYVQKEKYVVLKDKISSSNHTLVANLIKFGYIEESNIIKFSRNEELDNIEIIDNSIILVIDDYVGSGNSIISILKEIECKYINQTVLIISYIWQENSRFKVEEYINEEKRNNEYIIYDEKSILETSYKAKFVKESNILKYINNRCNRCRAKKFKFGWNNSGAMIVINGMSPNNNISMLWRNDLGKNWIPPFNRDISVLALQKKKEKIIKESYPKMRRYYEMFCYKELLTFDEFKMLLLIFNSYCIQINRLTMLLGFDTDNETENIIRKYEECGILKYEVNNFIEFIDKKIINQFKRINNEINREALDGLKKESTSEVKL